MHRNRSSILAVLFASVLLAITALIWFLLLRSDAMAPAPARVMEEGAPGQRAPPSSTEPRESARVAPGETPSPDPTSESTPSRETGPARGALSGEVLEELTGRAIHGALVHVAFDLPVSLLEQGAWIARCHTDVEGRFRLDGLVDSQYQLRVVAPGRSLADERGLRLGDDVEILMPAAPDLPCLLVLEEDGHASPLPNTTVQLSVAELGWELEAQSDERGKFNLHGVEPVQLHAAYETLSLRIVVPGYVDPALFWKLTAESVRYTLVVEEALTVRGTVIDKEDGSPIEDATVVSDSGHSTTTDPDGHFLMRGVTDTLCAFADGYALASRELDEPDDGMEVRTVIRLTPGVAIFGKVTDAEGSPLEGVRVGVMPDELFPPIDDPQLEGNLGKSLSGVSNAKGEYRIEGISKEVVDLPGEIELEVRPKGCQSGLSMDIHVPRKKGDVEHDISVPLFPVRGSVQDESGAGLSAALILVESEDEELYQIVHAGAEGDFELSPLPEGSYRIVVFSTQGPMIVLLFDVPTAPLELQVEAPCEVAGRVVLERDGSPLGDMQLRLLLTRGGLGPHLTRLTGADGTFAFEALPAGDYPLDVTAPESVNPYLALAPRSRHLIRVEAAPSRHEVRHPERPSGELLLLFRRRLDRGGTEALQRPVHVQVLDYRRTGSRRSRSLAVNTSGQRQPHSLGVNTERLRIRLREGTYLLRFTLEVEGRSIRREEKVEVLRDTLNEREVIFKTGE